MEHSERQMSWIPKFLIVVAIVAASGAFIYTQAKKSHSDIALIADEHEATEKGESVFDEVTSGDVSPVEVVPVEQSVTPTAPVVPAQSGQYKDGRYTANGRYSSPAGPETIGVTLAVQNDIVTDVSFSVQATNPASKMWQEQFGMGCKMLVVGKPLKDISMMSAVSGASLTTKGFNDALANIRNQAGV